MAHVELQNVSKHRAELTIGEVAAHVGVATSTIRYYEKVGLLQPADRVNGQRRFTVAVLHQLRLIKQCQSAGLTLLEIQLLLKGPKAE